MKKVLSFMLIISICVFSLIACKKSNDVRVDFFEDLEKSQNIETGQMSLELHLGVPNEKDISNPLTDDNTTLKEIQDIFVKVNLDIQNSNTVKLKTNLYYKNTKESEYMPLTDILIENEDYYINLGALKDFIVNAEFLNELDGVNEIKLILGNMELDYLKITKEELLEMTETYTTIESANITAETENVDYNLTKELLLRVFLDTFKEIESEYEETLITYKDETYEIRLNADLIRDIYKKIDIIVNRDIENIANELLVTNYGDNIPEDILNKKDELVNEIKIEANKLSTVEFSDNANINYQFKFTEDKDIFNSFQKISAMEDETFVEISLFNTNDVSTDGFIVPENTITIEELMQYIMTALFM